MKIAVSSVIPALVIRPAACQVVPAVSSCRSSSSTSVTPRCARWYATLVPITPPPTMTTRARAGRSPVLTRLGGLPGAD